MVLVVNGHAVLEQSALAGDRWRVRCECGDLFTARDKPAAVAAHLAHYEHVKAREAAAEGLPAARAALANGRVPLRLVKGDG